MLAAPHEPVHQPNGAAILSEQQRAAQLQLDLDLGRRGGDGSTEV